MRLSWFAVAAAALLAPATTHAAYLEYYHELSEPYLAIWGGSQVYGFNTVMTEEQLIPMELKRRYQSTHFPPNSSYSGRGQGIASYGSLSAPYGWSPLGYTEEQAKSLTFVYAAAAAGGTGISVQSHAVNTLRILPGPGEFIGTPITLKLELAEGVWSHLSASENSLPLVQGAVWVSNNGDFNFFGNDIYATEGFSAGHDPHTYVVQKEVQARIGDYVRLSLSAFAGQPNQYYPSTSGVDHEIAAFLFAEVPSNGIRFFSNFVTNSELSEFPDAPIPSVPEPSSRNLCIFGLLALVTASRINLRHP